MALTLSDGDLAWIREYVGDVPADGVLINTLNEDGVETKENVVRRVLTKRLANFAARPADFTVPGEYSQNVGANIKAIQDMLKGLPTVAEVVDEAASSVTLVAPRRRCR